MKSNYIVNYNFDVSNNNLKTLEFSPLEVRLGYFDIGLNQNKFNKDEIIKNTNVRSGLFFLD